MKITKRELNRLIENFLLEAGTGGMKGSSDSSKFNKDPDADDFELTDDMLDPDQSAHEEYVKAVDAYRHPNKPVGNFPHLFKNKTPHIPSDEELEHVRRYQAQEIGGAMPSVDDREVTIANFGEDEVTEESPFGTQYSLDDTDTLYRWDDKTPTDPGFTAHSDDDFYLGPEDEEGYIEPEEYTENDTEYGIEEEEKDPGLIAKIRKALGI